MYESSGATDYTTVAFGRDDEMDQDERNTSAKMLANLETWFKSRVAVHGTDIQVISVKFPGNSFQGVENLTRACDMTCI